MTELRPLASDIHLGGTTVSVSMLGAWWKCPRLWYFNYLHPTGDARGVEPRYTGSPLIVGSGFHIGLHAYYASGKEGPDWSMDAGLAAARAMFAARRNEFETDERWATDLAETERMLLAYAREYEREWPDLRPAAVEQTYTVQLRTGHNLSVRPDMLAYNFGQLVTVEHKCPGANRVQSTIGAARLGGQGLAQAAVLRAHDVPTNGMLLNIAVRGDYRVLKSGPGYTSVKVPFKREVIAHPIVLVDYVLELAATTCQDIVAAVNRWGTLRDDGMAPMEAARIAFPMAGLFSNQCAGNYPCSMFSLCSSPGREAQTIATNFRTRTYKADTIPQEPTE